MTKRATQKRTERVVVLMSPQDMEAIRSWMMKNQNKSFGDAVRRLSVIGLQFEREGVKNERRA